MKTRFRGGALLRTALFWGSLGFLVALATTVAVNAPRCSEWKGPNVVIGGKMILAGCDEARP